MNCSLPGSSIHGIFQARVVEWGAMAFSGPDSWSNLILGVFVRVVLHQWMNESLVTSAVSDSVTSWTVACQAPLSMGFSRQESWSGLPCPLLGIFLIQRFNLHLLHCRQILYHWATGEALLLSSNKVKQIDPQCGCGSSYQWRDEQKSWLTWTEHWLFLSLKLARLHTGTKPVWV